MTKTWFKILFWNFLACIVCGIVINAGVHFFQRGIINAYDAFIWKKIQIESEIEYKLKKEEKKWNPIKKKDTEL